MTIKERDLKAVFDYQNQLFKKPKLTYLFLELTNACNLNCIHCGSDCSTLKKTFLNYQLISDLLNEVAENYNPREIMICITGGEPLLHSDLEKIIKLAKEKGFLVGMTTNATLVSEEKAKNLSKSGLDTIAVSLDGIGKTHDKFRNVNNSFEKAIEGIRNFQKEGFYPQIVTVIHKNNHRLFQRACGPCLEQQRHRHEHSHSYSFPILMPMLQRDGCPTSLRREGKAQDLHIPVKLI